MFVTALFIFLLDEWSSALGTMEADDSSKSLKEVAKVPSALHEFNDRLHAGVELVGRNKEAIRDLTDQVPRPISRSI